jgi:Flp pilus assembly protein TadG
VPPSHRPKSDRSDEGFQALELAILFPIIVLFAVLAVGATRTFAAKNEVTAAAHSAARAGSIAVGSPTGAAEQEARHSLTSGSHCTNAAIDTSVRVWGSLKLVRTTVTCTLRVSDLGLNFHQTVSATAEEPYDRDHD